MNNLFTNPLNNKIIKRGSRKNFSRAVFAAKFNRNIRDLLEKRAFEKSNANWIDVLPKIAKHYNNKTHLSTKLTPIQALFKKNDGYRYFYQSLLNRRRKIQPTHKIRDLVEVANSKRTSAKNDTTNWSYKLYEITETVNHTLPSYKIDDSQERYKQAYLKKTKLTRKEKIFVLWKKTHRSKFLMDAKRSQGC